MGNSIRNTSIYIYFIIYKLSERARAFHIYVNN